MKTIAEQIRDLEATRAAKAARMNEVVQKSMDEGRSTDESEQEEFDTLDTEIKQIDGDLVRLKRLESLAIQKGRTVVDDGEKSGEGRGAPTLMLKKTTDVEDKFEGQSFVRKLIAKACAIDEAKELGMPGRSPAQIAEARWGKTNPQLVQVIRAGVAGGGSGSGEWGAELVTADSRYTGDFISYLYGKTLFDQLGLREVPANVTIKGQDGTATANWVGESKAIPISKADFSTVNLTPLKVAALAVVSNELIRDSSPAAEALVRDALVEASSQKVDTTFLSTSAASAGVSPAGILNGVAGHNTHGSSIDGLIADIKQLYGFFTAAKNATGLHFVVNPSLAKAISLMQNSLGQKAFPNITTMGGSLEGDPVVTGENVNASHLILLKPSDIWRIGDSGIQVSMSREATIEMNSVPTGASDTPVAASATPVNMFQSESTAIKVVRPINFQTRRSGVVRMIDNADYGSTDTST
jgi:hypothetical protein